MHSFSAPYCDIVPVDSSIGTIDFYSLVVEREYVFVQKSVGDVTSLYVSYKRGPFKKAFFPRKVQPLVSALYFRYLLKIQIVTITVLSGVLSI